MTPRIEKLRSRSIEAVPTVSIERALVETEFYQQEIVKHSPPMLRALFSNSFV